MALKRIAFVSRSRPAEFEIENSFQINKLRPRVCPAIEGVYQQGGAYYLHMQRCERSLESLVQERGALPLETVLEIGLQTARNLKILHEHNYAHLDLKPENILLLGERFLLADFGFSVNCGSEEQLRRLQEGDSRYAAPEILLKDFSLQLLREERIRIGKADIFSLGVLLMRCLRGTGWRVPSGGEPWENLRKFRNFPVRLLLATGSESRKSDFFDVNSKEASFSGRQRVLGRVRGLVAGMLSAEPSLRPSAARIEEILRFCRSELLF